MTGLQQQQSPHEYCIEIPRGAGRRWLLHSEQPVDLLTWLASVCVGQALGKAVFTFIGRTCQATFGIFDHKQQVYVTHQQSGDFEIVACRGHVNARTCDVEITATIILADQGGKLCGGQLFSPTIIQSGELLLEELFPKVG